MYPEGTHYNRYVANLAGRFGWQEASELARFLLRQLIAANAMMPAEPAFAIHLAAHTGLTGLMLMNAVIDGPSLMQELPRLPSLASLMLTHVGPRMVEMRLLGEQEGRGTGREEPGCLSRGNACAYSCMLTVVDGSGLLRALPRLPSLTSLMLLQLGFIVVCVMGCTPLLASGSP